VINSHLPCDNVLCIKGKVLLLLVFMDRECQYSMVLSDYTKLWILSLHSKGYKVSTIVEYLVLENSIIVSKQSSSCFSNTSVSRVQLLGSGFTPMLSPYALLIQ